MGPRGSTRGGGVADPGGYAPRVSVPDDPTPFPPFGLHATERIYRSDRCGLRRDTVVLPGGALQEYHVIEIPDAVCVLPLLDDGSVVMIGQYRYPHGRTHWELPAGRIAEGEPPEQAAARELLEETGHRAGALERLPGFYPANGITAHYAHVFRATGCRAVGPPTPDPSEQLVVRVFAPREVRALLEAGRIQDGFSALALMRHLLFGSGG